MKERGRERKRERERDLLDRNPTSLLVFSQYDKKADMHISSWLVLATGRYSLGLMTFCTRDWRPEGREEGRDTPPRASCVR